MVISRARVPFVHTRVARGTRDAHAGVRVAGRTARARAPPRGRIGFIAFGPTMMASRRAGPTGRPVPIRCCTVLHKYSPNLFYRVNNAIMNASL